MTFVVHSDPEKRPNIRFCFGDFGIVIFLLLGESRRVFFCGNTGYNVSRSTAPAHRKKAA
jgi:hypothetical protein